VLFLLPWQDHTLVGTTDNPAEIQTHPKATEEEIEYILRHVHKYFSIPVTKDDVLASWSGLRPLVSDPEEADTAKLSRDHVINIAKSGLLTIAGGKWTTYRKMALDTVDQAIAIGGLSEAGPSRTETLKLIGADRYSPAAAGELQEVHALDLEVASHLSSAYGDQAGEVADLIGDSLGQRLADDHPFLEAEVIYAARHEMARTTVDVLARRMRLGFLEKSSALQAISRVSALLAAELGWSAEQAVMDRADATAHLL
jgi:glycerol-3-phosphate dehydrogenase